MMKEIGGNFCEELLKSSKEIQDSQRILWFDSGRSAIRCLLDWLGDKIKCVMLPQYICESVLIPFIEKGYHIIFYPIDRKMKLLREEFEQLLKVEHPQLVLVQGYFGFDTLQEARVFLKELSKQGIIVVEDITHSLLTDCWQECADYIVGSLRKWCSIPDGGLLIKASGNFKDNTFEILRQEENIEFISVRLAAQKEKRTFLSDVENCTMDKQMFVSLYDKSEDLLDKQSKYYTMSKYTRKRINSVDWKMIAYKRRENYCMLGESLKDIDDIKIIFPYVSDNTVPLYFPVYIDKNKRNSFRYSMRKNNILLPIIWPVPSFFTNGLLAEVKGIYDEILAIPCDQRYTEQDMRFIANNMKQHINGEDIEYEII